MLEASFKERPEANTNGPKQPQTEGRVAKGSSERKTSQKNQKVIEYVTVEGFRVLK